MSSGSSIRRPRLVLLARIAASALLLSSGMRAKALAAPDPYLWLEAPTDAKALSWSAELTAVSKAKILAMPAFETVSGELKSTLSSAPAAPTVSIAGAVAAKVVRDVDHPHGMIEVADRGPDGAPRTWRIALDIDALRAAEGRPYELHGFDLKDACLPPAYTRCVVSLSPGGGDEVELREFDLGTARFVDGGFRAPSGRTQFVWMDQDTLLAASSAATSLTAATGWPLTVRRWTRGQALAEAPEIWRGQPKDALVNLSTVGEGRARQGLITRAIDYSHFEFALVKASGEVRSISLPVKVKLAVAGIASTSRHLIFAIAEPARIGGRLVPADSLIAYDVSPGVAEARRTSLVWSPRPGVSMYGFSVVPQVAGSRSSIAYVDLRDLRPTLWRARFARGSWTSTRVADHPIGTSLGLASADPLGDDLVVWSTGYLEPDRLDLIREGAPPKTVYQRKPLFDASAYRVELRHTASRDGAPVDYYLVRPDRPAHPGATPTLATGYGAFGLVFAPGYLDDAVGGPAMATWFSRGGALAMPIIRGGGEHGEAFHRAAMREHRQRSYDDFISAVVDLEHGFTTPAHMGVYGVSNGGLLAATVSSERPDLFGAVVSDAPLTDMLRLKTMGMGAAWTDEYGDPDVATMRPAIAAYSPYENVRKGVRYPPFLLTVATTDNRVGPGHARKMAARLQDAGAPVYFLENTEGGHGASDALQHPELMAQRMTFLINFLTP